MSHRSQDINLMKRACLLCDNSLCEVKTAALAVSNGKVIEESWNREQAVGEGVVHAEKALIIQAADSNTSLENAVLYVTRFPCDSCAKLIYKAGIKEIFYMSDHFTSGNSSGAFLKDRGIKISQIKEEEIWGAKF